MTPPTIIGIDPGLTGAIACLHADTGALIWVEDMPIHGLRADIVALVELLEAETDCTVFVEKPYMPGGRRQAEAQWWNYHACVGAAILTHHAVTLTRAAEWVAADPSLHVLPGDYPTKAKHERAKKARRRERAGELYPAHRGLFAKAKHDGRADAVLIARWGWEAQR